MAADLAAHRGARRVLRALRRARSRGASAWLRGRLGAGRALALAPALWVAGEWLRGWLMGGFPWGLLGYSQHGALPVIQIAELGGVYAVSFLIVAVNAALAGLLALGPAARLARRGGGERPARGARSPSACRAIGGASAGRAPARCEVAVIQPSIEQTLKWDPAHHARDPGHLRAAHPRGRARRGRPSSSGRRPRRTIFLRGDPALLERAAPRCRRSFGTPLLVGSIDRRDGPRGQFLNSAFLLTGQGITGKYDKIHLVPFGEYVPLAGLIGFVRSWAEFISDFGSRRRRDACFRCPGAPFGTVICYEVIFPELFRGFVVARRDASWPTSPTTRGSGETSGPWQHLGMLPLRAVEHRVAIARAANTGISAFVEPSGRDATDAAALRARRPRPAAIPLRERDDALHAVRRLARRMPALGAVGARGVGLALFRRSPASCSAS